MNRARIVFAVHPFGWGGAEKHLEDLIVRADPARIEPVIVAFAPNEYAEALRRHGRPDVVVQTMELPSTFRRYRRIFAGLNADAIVFVNGMLGQYPWWAYAAARASGAGRVVALEHLQGEAAPPMVNGRGPLALVRRAAGWRARLMYRYKLTGQLTHLTICVSNAVRRRLVDEYGYPEAKTATVLNGIDLGYYRHSGASREQRKLELGIDRNAELIVSVARLARPKRLDRLLDSMAAIRGHRTALQCIIIGGGPLEAELKARSRALGLDDVVRFAGHQADVRPYLEAADVYVIPSDREGFGLALAEAMAFELPCVATNIGGHDEVLADPATGVLVEPDDQAAFLHAIERLLDHPAEAQAMGRAARKAVEARFDIERMVRELLAAFLNGHRA